MSTKKYKAMRQSLHAILWCTDIEWNLLDKNTLIIKYVINWDDGRYNQMPIGIQVL